MVKTRMFQSNLQQPIVPGDGSSLQEQVNSFLATVDAKKLLDVVFETASTGKYGLTTTYFAQVVYTE